ncbi:MAG: hypothetical protein ACTS3F_02390 [Phycisphaerales bacterium]
MATSNGLASPKFDLDWARSVVLLWAFLISFVRWHIKTRQDTLSEAFERKQKSNELIIREQKELAKMVSGAVNPPRDRIDDGYKLSLTPEECEDILLGLRTDAHNELRAAGATAKDPAGSPTFTQKMFVFYELDNLEFVYDKYKDGLIDDPEMYRACQIFESRCLNVQFRRLAYALSRGNYSFGFLDTVDAIFVIASQRDKQVRTNLLNSEEQ